MKTKPIAFCLLLFAAYLNLNAQIAPGQWRDELPYHTIRTIIQIKDRIYCQTDHSLFYYDRKENNLSRMNKIQGLSEVGVAAIAYSESKDFLIVGYTSTNIDLVKDNTILNFPEIKNKIGLTNKVINRIVTIGDEAYVCCGFGVVVIDLNKLEIRDTYYIGDGSSNRNISDICLSGDSLLAATDKGIYSADYNDPNLVNYANWHRTTDIPEPMKSYCEIESFNGNIYAATSDSAGNKLYVLHAGIWNLSTLSNAVGISKIISGNNKLILLNNNGVTVYNTSFDEEQSLSQTGIVAASVSSVGELWISRWSQVLSYVANQEDRSFYLNGPMSEVSFNIAVRDGSSWIAHGSYIGNNYVPNYSLAGVAVNHGNGWLQLFPGYSPALLKSHDFITIALHPQDPGHAYGASLFGQGLVEFINYGASVKVYNSLNTDGAITTTDTALNYRVGGMSFDKDNNLWFSCQFTSHPLVVRKSDGTFKGYYLNGMLKTEHLCGPVLVTSTGQKWIALGNGKGLFVFDDNGTIDNESDDTYDFVDVSVRDAESGQDAYRYVYCMAEDKEGNVWLGTKNGPVVYYSPSEILTNSAIMADRIKIPKYDGKGTATILLENETVYSIAIDGANRKWMGTASSGVFLFSSDGKKQIANYREENSPLFSNYVRTVAVDNKTGEVFMGTGKGVIVYRGQSTEGGDDFGHVYVYPNPVKEDFEGDIIVAGMAANVNVKITDISGNLVYETTALGGQAAWNGKTFAGERVHTGVYLVFCTNQDGSKTFITKLLFIH